MATYMATLKKPPNSAAVCSATVHPTPQTAGAAAAAETGGGGGGEGVASPTGAGAAVTGPSDASGKSNPDLLSPAQLGSVRSLLDHPVAGPEMRVLLDKHRRAELAAAEERCSEKAGALDVAGKTWKQVLGARVAYHGQLVREGADIAARKGTEGEARKTETSRARKVYEERLRYAQEQLDAFIAEDARREAQWTAHFADLAEKNEARVRAAEAAVAKVKQAVEAAGDAADRVITEAEAAEWAKAMGGDGGISAAAGDSHSLALFFLCACDGCRPLHSPPPWRRQPPTRTAAGC